MLSRRMVTKATRLESDPALTFRGIGKTPLIPKPVLAAPGRMHLAAGNRFNAKIGTTETLEAVLEALASEAAGGVPAELEEKVLPDGWTPLMHAVRSGRLADVEILLRLGADCNTRDWHGNSPLHKAAIAGAGEKVKVLIEHGADIEAYNRFGRTPLHEAADVGWRDVCALLVRLGARHDAKDGPLRDGMTPFQVASNAGWVDVCAALKANERRRVRLSGGGTELYSATFPSFEPQPFSPKRMNVHAEWGRDSRHGTWGTAPDPTKPKFTPRECKFW